MKPRTHRIKWVQVDGEAIWHRLIGFSWSDGQWTTAVRACDKLHGQLDVRYEDLEFRSHGPNLSGICPECWDRRRTWGGWLGMKPGQIGL